MRIHVLAYGLGALGLAGLVLASEPATAAKTKMGCEVGKEVWNAAAGRCVPGKSKYSKTAAKKSAKKAGKKAAPAAKGTPAAKTK